MRNRLLASASILMFCVGGGVPTYAATLPVAVIAARSIDSNESYAGQTVVLAGTVTVNAELDLENDQILVLPGTDVIVKGTLQLGASQWSGADSTMEDLGALRATDFVADKLSMSITGSAVLTRASFSNSQSDLIDVTNGSLNATSLTLYAAAQVGLRAIDSSVSLHDATVSGTNGYALSTERGTFDASRLYLSASNDYGLWANGGSVNLSESIFGGDCGVYLGPSTTGSVDGTSFSTKNHGLTQYQTGSVTLRGLSFEGQGTGLYIVASPVSVHGIDARNGGAFGIVVTNSAGTIDGGVLTVGTGVQVTGSEGLAPTIRNMNFSESTTGVDNVSTTTVDARWNYWGATPAVNGSVLTSPWLTAPPH